MEGDICSHSGLHSMINALYQFDKLSISSISARVTHNSVHAPEVRRRMSTCETVFAPYAAFIPDFSAFCTALQSPRTCCLRVNTLRTTPEAIQVLLVSQGYDVTPSPQYRKSRPVSPSYWNSALWGLAPKRLFCMSLHC